MTLAGAGAVCWYTLVELRRRRLLMAFLVLEALITAGLGLAPLVLPGFSTGEQRTLFLLAALSGSVGPAILLGVLGIGMTIVNHDIESGAIAAILAKPLPRLGYTAGKLAAAAAALALLASGFAAGCLALVALNGRSDVAVLATYFLVTAANALVWMVLLMALTVYLNNVVAALVTLAMVLAESVVVSLHSLVQHHLIASRLSDGVIEGGYWMLPRPLASDLERHIVEISQRLHPSSTAPVPLQSIPGASGPGDVAVWVVYVAVLCALLALAVRRKQV